MKHPRPPPSSVATGLLQPDVHDGSTAAESNSIAGTIRGSHTSRLDDQHKPQELFLIFLSLPLAFVLYTIM
ncbi:Uncharacterized protein APZ42_007678 [Daphnia magna]|uniref:Uncharacterized protein n=1 Tax=Daphnia magna TaxID=35525 RepID=A0A164F5K3_9CRUS|nr:Uncharacterized protein APZ42_007678 [Daphnia magna]